LTQQLAATAERYDAELVTHGVLEGQLADLEKEKTLVELELKDTLIRHKTELGRRDQTIASVRYFVLRKHHYFHCAVSRFKVHSYYTILW
jgi:hypothetical protein